MVKTCKVIGTKHHLQTQRSKRNLPTTTANPKVGIMVERFVQSIKQINDSGSFDTSFEIKHIQSPQYVRHRCVTELDRENLMKFVQAFEQRQQQQKDVEDAAKGSPYLCRKAKAIYANAFMHSRSSSPKPATEQTSSSTATPQLERASSERLSCRSAAKVLQFFSAKKRNKPDTATTSSLPPSPVLLRSQLGCQPLYDDNNNNNNNSDTEAETEDDGISSASSSAFTHQSGSSNSNYSRHGSPDSSFELHSPLVPTFKVTPAKSQLARASKNAAYEFARFLRGSFHAKRATITTLRRSISDPDNFPHIECAKFVTAERNQSSKTQKLQPRVLSDATNLPQSATETKVRVSHF